MATQAEKDAAAAKRKNKLDLKAFFKQVTAGVKKDDLSLSAALQKLGLQSAAAGSGGSGAGSGASGGSSDAGGSGGANSAGSGGSGGSPAPSDPAKTGTAAGPGIDWKIIVGGVLALAAIGYLIFGRKKNRG